jgi:hypothetical protein
MQFAMSAGPPRKDALPHHGDHFMARKYFTVIERCPIDKTWSPQFGDFDRNVAVEEAQSMHDQIGFTIAKGTKFKIITTSPKQDDINAHIAALNARINSRI